MIQHLEYELAMLKKQIAELNLANKDVLNVPEASKYIGVTEKYMYKLVSERQISSYKPNGKNLYFSRLELNDYMLSNKRQSRSEAAEMAEEFLINKKRA